MTAPTNINGSQHKVDGTGKTAKTVHSKTPGPRDKPKDGSRSYPESLFDDFAEHELPLEKREGMRYTPDQTASAPSPTAPSCANCRNNDGTCGTLCNDIERLVSNDRTGKARKEYTNEFDLESRVKPVAMPSSRDFSRLLVVPHIYTAQQLAAVRLMHQGESRPAICRKLGVSNSRVSQLVKGALNRFEHHEARLRALTALELKRLGASASEGDKDSTLSGSQQA